jgi:hypothetical protein
MMELSPADRVMNVKDALWFAQEKIPHFVEQETGIAAYEALKGIIPALLASLAFVTLTTVIGAGAGVAVGSLGFGLGAVPLGIAGGTVGFKTGLWILNIVGLAFLVEHMGSSLWVAVRHIEEGILIAWGPKSEKDSSTLYDGDVIKAGERIALGVAVIIRCIIEAIAIYLTVRGIAKLPELVANLKRSKLGEGFAVWVEQNHLKILNIPNLNIRAGAGGTAPKPAKVLDHTNVPEQPRMVKTGEAALANSRNILEQVGQIMNKKKSDIQRTLEMQGFSKSNTSNGGEIWIKAGADGNTVSVRLDPAIRRTNSPGFSDEVPHAHKEIVPSDQVVNGNYPNKRAMTYDDFGNKTGKADYDLNHIPIIE